MNSEREKADILFDYGLPLQFLLPFDTVLYTFVSSCGYFKWSNISSFVHGRICINSSLCVRRRIMYHYGGSTGPGRPPAYAVSDGEVCRRERVHFNSSNSNETAKPDRKPMCWGQVS